MNVAKDSFFTAQVNGKIYALGGNANNANISNTALTDAEVYDPLLDQWTALAPLPTAEWDGACAAANNKIYLFGGTDGTNFVTTVFEFDIATNTWTTKSSMPAARVFSRAAVLNGLIYVIGGTAGGGTGGEVYVYDPVADSWSNGVSLPRNLQSFSGGTIGSSIYVTAGYYEPGAPGNLVFNDATYRFSLQSGPQSIADIITLVNGTSSLNSGQQNSLTSKLQAAQASISSGNTNAACGQLGAFINEVNARRRSGSLDQSTANILITFIAASRQSLGCPP